MKAVQVVSRGTAHFVDVPKPQLKHGYALIKTSKLALCGSDVRYLHHLPDDHYPSPIGTTGHEMVGVIEAIASDNTHFNVGDKVLALAPDHCAMAEYYLASVDNLLPLDENIPLVHHVQAQQLGTVLFASKHLPDLNGKTVAIIGQGSAGLWFNTAVKDLGASKIIALDLKAYRLQYSQQYGATHTIHNTTISPQDALREINEGQLPDVVIEAAGEKASITLAVDLVKQSGFILYFGVPRFEEMTFPIMKYFNKCITARSIVHASSEQGHTSTHKALDMITTGQVDVAPMITHSFPFREVMQAYELHRMQDEGAIKIIIDMEAD